MIAANDRNASTSLSWGCSIWRISLTLTLLAALTACHESSLYQAAQKVAAPPQKITVAFTLQPQSSLVHVAIAKGYFTEEGLDVRPLIQTYGKEALQSVVENKADFATVAETPVMFSILDGKKIFVIANIEASSMNNGIVARKDTGIAAPADLKGKRIGFTRGTTSDFYLDSLLTANGLTRTQIQPVALKPDEIQDAIMAKRVDAVSTWNYPLTQIRHQLGAAVTTFYDREIYTETFNIAARQDFVQKNPEAVKRFLRALIRAEDFVAKNPDEAQSIMSAATRMDKSLIHDVWNGFSHRVVLDQTLLITLEDETRWAIKNRLTEAKDMPDYRSYIHIDSLKAIKPEAIEINR